MVRSILMTSLLTALYVLLILPARGIGWLCGRDSLRLRPMRERPSYWLAAPAVTSVESYYSQFSDGGAVTGEASPDAPKLTSGPAIRVLRMVSGWFASGRSDVQTTASAGRRTESIPDEIYTLW